MKLIYTAGPIRDERGPWYVKQNHDRAANVALELWNMGHAVICPHLNTQWMDGPLSHEQFIAGDLEIVKRCDALVMLPGWRSSEGAMEEYRCAKAREKDIFMWPSDETRLRAYVRAYGG